MSLPGSIPLSTLLVLGFLVLPGCQKSGGTDGSGAPAASSSSSASVVTPATAPPSPASAAGSIPVPPEGMQSIPERFATEAKNRPTGTVRAEDVIAAFKDAGANIREQRQHLGAPFLAAYCVGGQTGTDVHFSICEYTDAARAKEGKAQSEQAFGAVPNRTIYVNGATTLTLRVGGTTEADRELGKKLPQAFNGLAVKK